MSDEQKIVIKFADIGSADFSVFPDEGITANQLLALAGWFEYQAKQILADMTLAQRFVEQQRQQDLESKIIRPKDMKVQ